MEKDISETVIKNEVKANMLLQLHIAEYNMLTTRHTYLVTLQYGLISVLLVSLTIIASLWDNYNHSILIWIAFSIGQLFALIMTTNLFEINNIILYMERDLRISIHITINDNLQSATDSLVKAHDFLKFEKHQTTSNNSYVSRYFELILEVFILILFGLVICSTTSFEYVYLIFSFDLFILIIISINTLKILKLRNEFSEIHKKNLNEK